MAKIRTGNSGSKREVILQKAAFLFRTKSYSASTMRELAEELGIEAPSLYNHIGSKRELLEAICIKIGDRFMLEIETIEKSNITSLQKIEAIIRFHIQMMLLKFDEVYVANHEWKHLHEPYLSNFLNIRRNYEKSLVTLVETGIEEDEIKIINPYVAVSVIISAVRGLEFWHRNKKNISPEELENEMVNHLLNGIAK